MDRLRSASTGNWRSKCKEGPPDFPFSPFVVDIQIYSFLKNMDVTVLRYYTVLISQQDTKHVRTCFGQKNDILKFGAQQNNPLSNTICIGLPRIICHVI